MSLTSLVDGVQTLAVVCNQWGDTGKGKFVDYFATNWADIIARGAGGNNAGHTTVINGKKRVFHLLPSGIIHEDKINILGNGMVIDLKVLNQELDELEKEGINYQNLRISEDAHVILPYHIAIDAKGYGSLKNKGIGSTKRGIGPAYTSKIERKSGIFIRDLFDVDTLDSKLDNAAEFFHIAIDKNRIVEELKPYAERIKPFVRNTIVEIHQFIKAQKRILLEGAQGLLLSVEFGTYPFVTSSDPSINGTAAGIGISAKAVDLVLGIVKFPYMTRVGGGPFPSELGGSESEKYCAEGLEHNIKYELGKYGIQFKEEDGNIIYNHHHKKIVNLINSTDQFEKGVGIRLAGEEYGATTGRPRRVGWTDLVALRYAVGINGPNVILTKPDVLQGVEEFQLADVYSNSLDFTRDVKKLSNCKPSYKTFSGFSENLAEIESFDDVPGGLKDSIKYAELMTGANVRIISTGPDRNQDIIR